MGEFVYFTEEQKQRANAVDLGKAASFWKRKAPGQ